MTTLQMAILEKVLAISVYAMVIAALATSRHLAALG